MMALSRFSKRVSPGCHPRLAPSRGARWRQRDCGSRSILVARVATFSVQIRAKPFLGQGRIAGVCGRSTGDDRMGGIRPIEASKTVVSPSALRRLQPSPSRKLRSLGHGLPSGSNDPKPARRTVLPSLRPSLVLLPGSLKSIVSSGDQRLQATAPDNVRTDNLSPCRWALDHLADFAGKRLHRERLGDNLHTRLQERTSCRVLGVSRHE